MRRTKAYRDCLVVIPSRYASTRFPGKVLARLAGREVVEWCYQAAKRARLGPVVVATEDRRVAKAVQAFGGEALMTSPRCGSGSDRVHEAAKRYQTPFILNLQGDLPLVSPSTLRRVVKLLRDNPKADIATAVIPLQNPRRAADPNVVKAALGAQGRALYFSRSPIPFSRNGRKAPRYEHLGLYAFRRPALARFVRLPPSPLEKAESLEQLRALGDGMSIYAAVVHEPPVAIDTPADLRRAESFLKKSRPALHKLKWKARKYP